jgi:hypothetical protein
VASRLSDLAEYSELLVGAETYIEQLNEALKSGNRSRIRQYEKQAARSAKQTLRFSKKQHLKNLLICWSWMD